MPTKAVPQVVLFPSLVVRTTAPLGATCIALQSPVSFRIARSTWRSPAGVCATAVATAVQTPAVAGVGLLSSAGVTM